MQNLASADPPRGKGSSNAIRAGIGRWAVRTAYDVRKRSQRLRPTGGVGNCPIRRTCDEVRSHARMLNSLHTLGACCDRRESPPTTAVRSAARLISEPLPAHLRSSGESCDRGSWWAVGRASSNERAQSRAAPAHPANPDGPRASPVQWPPTCPPHDRTPQRCPRR